MATVMEQERDKRIALNKAKLAELGIQESVQAVLATTQKPPSAAPKRARATTAAAAGDGGDAAAAAAPRRSARPRVEIDYAALAGELERVGGGGSSSREPVDYTEKIKALQLDSAEAEKLRLELEARRSAPAEPRKKRGAGGGTGAPRKIGPKDSGKGVRVQGGRVYDSTFGVTCHWCRQKTLEAHVTCTHPKCAASKMPYSFCHKCLKNRHGEDAEAAASSGCWVCPKCRGSCGAGCVTCCNCGPCRKKAGLEPTAQIVFLARAAGFGNAHDYLVHLVTGEAEAAIAARKPAAEWGAFLRPDGEGGSSSGGSGSGGSDASVETQQQEEEDDEEEAGGVDEGVTESEEQEQEEEECGSEQDMSTSEQQEEEEAVVEEQQQQQQQHAAAAAPPARKGAAPATAPASAAATAAPPKRVSPPVDAGAPADQDGKLSRKARMMQRIGLTPRARGAGA